MFFLNKQYVLDNSFVVVLDLEWISTDRERYIYQLAFSELFSTSAVNNVYICPLIESDGFSSAPKEALCSKISIREALEHLWSYIKDLRKSLNKHECFIVTHGAFSGDKEVLEEESKRCGCNIPTDIFWVDSKRCCEAVLSSELIRWKEENCKCLIGCICKTFSLSKIHSYVLSIERKTAWPNHAYHQAQNDVLALKHIVHHLWFIDKFSGTACPSDEIPFVNSENNFITSTIEMQLLANGVTKAEDLIEMVKNKSLQKYLPSLGFSCYEVENIYRFASSFIV